MPRHPNLDFDKFILWRGHALQTDLGSKFEFQYIKDIQKEIEPFKLGLGPQIQARMKKRRILQGNYKKLEFLEPPFAKLVFSICSYLAMEGIPKCPRCFCFYKFIG